MGQGLATAQTPTNPKCGVILLLPLQVKKSYNPSVVGDQNPEIRGV